MASAFPPEGTYEEASFAEVDAATLVRQVRERTRDRAEARDVDVLIHCAGRCVCVQSTALLDALYELLGAAIEATRRGHPVVIDVREAGHGEVLWEIHDTGHGAPAHAIAGLDVEFVRAVIEQHGGVLRYESAAGVGSTASVWLPGGTHAAA